jgi:FlaA1/EpsC-like NDP-sugar epimerase
MMDIPGHVGDSISPKYDPRVTTFGRFLRKTKLNEFPQFMNILKGEMTFVGPRPEAPDLVKLYPEKAKKLFSVRPGLVGPNDLTHFSEDIVGRNEEELYPPGVDVKKYYVENILPKKLELDLEYLSHRNIFRDIKYIYFCLVETVAGSFRFNNSEHNKSQRYLLISDILLSLISYILACALFFKTVTSDQSLINYFIYLPAIIAIRLPCYYLFGMYNSLIKYISFHEMLKIIKSVSCGSLFLILLGGLLKLDYYSILIISIDWILLNTFLTVLRFGLKYYRGKRLAGTIIRQKKRLLIHGAGDSGVLAYRFLVSEKNGPFDIIGFIDDSPDKYGKTLNGVKVLGNRYNINILTQIYKVEEILLAKQDANPGELSEIIEICKESGLRYRVFSSLSDLQGVNLYGSPIRSLQLSDILPLQKIHMDETSVKEIVHSKTVLIYGSGGALGLELCKQILHLGCKRLIIVDRYESYLTELIAALFNIFSKELIKPVLVGSNEKNTLDTLFDRYRPDIVFHENMKKYVPFFTINSDDVYRTNYVRTFDLAKLALTYQSDFFVMISSLEAGNGTNFIANSLRIAELSLKHFFGGSKTRLIRARICDIVENRGGIVSVIEEQISKQMTVTLPSVKEKAYLISKYSAVAFILQSLVESDAIETEEGIFVCEPGSPILISEIARKLASIHGLTLDTDLVIKYISLAEDQIPLPLSKMSSLISTHPCPLETATYLLRLR